MILTLLFTFSSICRFFLDIALSTPWVQSSNFFPRIINREPLNFITLIYSKRLCICQILNSNMVLKKWTINWLQRDSNPQPFNSYTNTQPSSQTGQMIEPCCEYLYVPCVWLYVLWPFWVNGWVFVYELNGCGFESRCSHLNFRFCACFEQGVPWHSGNYRVWIHSETRTWHDKNIQSVEPLINDRYYVNVIYSDQV